ncbi:MAG TPA: FIST N-terminal domain-containing protein [Polyangiaceae bacterium]|nr:FIST N-terminal domain-containing protein [Polyangiaceae bacterium]
MGLESRLRVREAHTLELDPDRAIATISEQLDARSASVHLLFCAPSYDLERLARAIDTRLAGPVIACTTVGQFGSSGFREAGITGVSLSSEELHVSPYLITPLAECQARASEAAFKAMSGMLERGCERGFGMVLVDSLSGAEERLAASLYQSLGTIPLIGGCAGDTPGGQGTQGMRVYHEGRFLRDAALFALFETTLPFATFKASHVVPGKHKLVVTMADPEQRVVQEFNGEPAAEAFAEALGMEVDELNPSVFSRNPLLFLSGGEHFVRCIRSVNADHGVTLYCALEVGLVLTVGIGGDPMSGLQAAFDGIEQKIGRPQVILGCNSVLRRVELERDRTSDAVGELLARHRAVGFSGYGEQYNAMYVNQMLSAVALSSG